MSRYDVLPRNNLPPESVPWGRALEHSYLKSAHYLESIRMGVHSANRATAGQMGVVGREVNDLRARTTQVTNIGRIQFPVTLPPNYGVTSARGTRSVVLPPPVDDKNRKSLLFLFGIAYNSDANSMGTVYIRVNGIVSKPMAAPAMTSTPEGYIETVSISTVLPFGNSFDIEFLLIGANNTESSRTIQLGLDDVSIVSVYGDES